MPLNFGFKMPTGKGEVYNPKKHKEEPGEHDPHANPLEGVTNVPGSDVVDPENYYNEPGFEGRGDQNYRDIIDEMKPAEEVGVLMDKYGLEEEFELKDLMKKCEDHLNDPKKAAPLNNFAEVEQLAGFYREYLTTQNEYGLPYSDEELGKFSAKEITELQNLYSQRSDLIMKISKMNEQAELNDASQNKDKGNQAVATKLAGRTNSEIIFSTEQKAAPVTDKKLDLRELNDIHKRIGQVERSLAKRSSDAPAKKEDWKKVPEYSAEELKLRQSCVDYFRNRNNPLPQFATGESLNEAQILEVVQEVAADENWPKSNFFEETYKNRRQLSRVEKFEDKRIKYTFITNTLPAGKYYFEADPDKFFVTKNNDKSAVAPLKLMVSAENPTKFMADREALKNRNQKATA